MSFKRSKKNAARELERTDGPREIVTTLMRNLGKVSRTKTNKNGITLTEEYVQWECQKPTCSKIIEVQAMYGFSNPYRHMENHYGRAEILKMHKEIVEECKKVRC